MLARSLMHLLFVQPVRLAVASPRPVALCAIDHLCNSLVVLGHGSNAQHHKTVTKVNKSIECNRRFNLQFVSPDVGVFNHVIRGRLRSVVNAKLVLTSKYRHAGFGGRLAGSPGVVLALLHLVESLRCPS